MSKINFDKNFDYVLTTGTYQIRCFPKFKLLALECYRVTRTFPNEEKFALTQQIRRAALSVHSNVAEGCSRKSVAERK